MSPRPAPWRAAAAGAVAAGAALAVTELVSAFDGAGSPSVVSAVGNRLVDAWAASLKDVAVALFGTGDKVALIVGIVVVALVVGGIAGLLERWRRGVGAVVFVAFGGIGIWAVATDARASVALLVAACGLGVAVGVATMFGLLAAAVARPGSPRPTSEPPVTAPTPQDPRDPGAGRRAFLVATGVAGATAAMVAVAGRGMRGFTGSGGPATATRALPGPAVTTPVPAGDLAAGVPGLSPYVTPNAAFYRIDTALIVPSLDASRWSMTIGGLTRRALTLTYDDLLAEDLVEVPITLSCVSNEVGGDLVGTAIWRGVPLARLLERAGVDPGAEQVLATSVDGFTAGFPLAALDGDRPALVAVGMNGEPLPARHGFPARLVVGGLYGYVSAVKWLREIRLTPWDGVDGYWIPRGWSKLGPIKTQSRIDVPTDGARVAAGPAAVAGVAWAPTRGIAAVEVSIDAGPWRPARLGAVASDATWVQWVLDGWVAEPGRHRIVVRAVDGDGVVQDPTIRPPEPDGATGWHAVTCVVPGP
jgi:DMSO/TMAO reductase YedYZ molybdopterin-dependent catalytic subunit